MNGRGRQSGWARAVRLVLGSGPVQLPDMLACQRAREISDDNQTMDVASDQEPAPLSKPVHAVFTIEQVRPHFEALIAEELPAQEDLCCNLRLLNEHRLAKG